MCYITDYVTPLELLRCALDPRKGSAIYMLHSVGARYLSPSNPALAMPVRTSLSPEEEISELLTGKGVNMMKIIPENPSS